MTDADFRELHHFETEQAMSRALGYLRAAEGANLDILSGRPATDALEEQAFAIGVAIRILEEATEAGKA